MSQDLVQRELLSGLLAVEENLLTQARFLEVINRWLKDAPEKGLVQCLKAEQLISESDLHRLMQSSEQRLAGRPGNSPSGNSSAGNSSAGDPPASNDSAVIENSVLTCMNLDPQVPSEWKQAADTDSDRRSGGLSVQDPQSRFEIVEEHARGGLGVVYKAEDRQLNRQVALKQVRSDRMQNGEYLQRFVREAEITGKLEHPGVVPVYSLGANSDGEPYYTMRFVQGNDLKSEIQSFHRAVMAGTEDFDGLTFRELLRQVISICNTMEFAHSRGILHRDLKPANIMSGDYGETLVVDWGLAKQLTGVNQANQSPISDAASFEGSGDVQELTIHGSFAGTPAYASPEQLLGKLDELCPASDVYSLGAILYELMTGQPPVSGNLSISEVYDRVINGRIPEPRSVNRRIGKSLNAICKKSMAPKLSSRYSQVADFRKDIESWMAELPVSAVGESVMERVVRWFRRHKAAATSVVITSVLISLFSVIGVLVINSYRLKADRALAESRLRSVEVAQGRGDLKESVRLMNELLSLDPQQPPKLRLDLAENYLALSMLSEAEQVLQEPTLSKDSGAEFSGAEIARHRYLQGILMLCRHEFDTAESLLTAAEQSGLLSAEDQLTCEGLTADRPAEAIRSLEAALQADRFNSIVRSRLAFLYALMGNLPRAREESEIGMQLHPGDPQFLFVRAMVHAIRGEKAQAIELIEVIAADLSGGSCDHLVSAIDRLNTLSDRFSTAVGEGGIHGDEWMEKLLVETWMTEYFQVIQSLYGLGGENERRLPFTAGKWVVTLRNATSPLSLLSVRTGFSMDFQSKSPIDDLLLLFPDNQMLLYLKGQVLFAEAQTASEGQRAYEILRRAAEGEGYFNGQKELSLDLAAATAVWIDSLSPIELQKMLAEVAVHGGMTRPDNPGDRSLFWGVLMKAGLYEYAEQFAERALRYASQEERSFWEDRIQRARYLRTKLRRLVEDSVRLPIETIRAGSTGSPSAESTP